MPECGKNLRKNSWSKENNIRRTLNEANRRLTEMENERGELIRRFEVAEEDRNDAYRRLGEVEAESGELSRKVDVAEEEKAELSRKLDVAEEEKAELRRKLDVAEEERNDAYRRLGEVEAERGVVAASDYCVVDLDEEVAGPSSRYDDNRAGPSTAIEYIHSNPGRPGHFKRCMKCPGCRDFSSRIRCEGDRGQWCRPCLRNRPAECHQRRCNDIRYNEALRLAERDRCRRRRMEKRSIAILDSDSSSE
jgi:seryl-tRNA synthetase